MLAKFSVDISVVKREIGIPLIIKNVTSTQGRGVHLCESEKNSILWSLHIPIMTMQIL